MFLLHLRRMQRSVCLHSARAEPLGHPKFYETSHLRGEDLRVTKNEAPHKRTGVQTCRVARETRSSVSACSDVRSGNAHKLPGSIDRRRKTKEMIFTRGWIQAWHGMEKHREQMRTQARDRERRSWGNIGGTCIRTSPKLPGDARWVPSFSSLCAPPGTGGCAAGLGGGSLRPGRHQHG